MFRRSLLASLIVLACSAGRADALTVSEIIDLSKAGLGESVLLALIEVEHSVFAIDPTTVKQLKAAGVSDAVIVAMIRSGRSAPAPVTEPVATQAVPSPQPEPQVVVIDHRDSAPAAPQPYPVAVPVYVPVHAV